MSILVFAVLVSLVNSISAVPNDPSYYNAFQSDHKAPVMPVPITVVTPKNEGVDLTPWITPMTIVIITVVVLLAILLYLFCNAERKVEMANLTMRVNCATNNKNSDCPPCVI